jgi:hypothetical protein
MVIGKELIEELLGEEAAQMERLREIRERLRVAAKDYWASEYGFKVGALIRYKDAVLRIDIVEKFCRYLDPPTLRCSRWAASQRRWALRSERIWTGHNDQAVPLTPAETAEFLAEHKEETVQAGVHNG